MVLEPFQGLVHSQERLFRKAHSKGVFTVNSSYVSINSSDQQGKCLALEQVWKTSAPYKVVLFMADGHKCLLNQDSLQRKDIQIRKCESTFFYSITVLIYLGRYSSKWRDSNAPC